MVVHAIRLIIDRYMELSFANEDVDFKVVPWKTIKFDIIYRAH